MYWLFSHAEMATVTFLALALAIPAIWGLLHDWPMIKLIVWPTVWVLAAAVLLLAIWFATLVLAARAMH